MVYTNSYLVFNLRYTSSGISYSSVIYLNHPIPTELVQFKICFLIAVILFPCYSKPISNTYLVVVIYVLVSRNPIETFQRFCYCCLF